MFWPLVGVIVVYVTNFLQQKLDYTISSKKQVVGGSAQKHPDVPVIVGHLGGVNWLDTLKAVRDIPNVYLDLSATFTTMAPLFAIQEYPERCLFSSDAPYCSPLTARTIIEQIVKDRHVLEQVLGGNISRLLKI